MFRPMSVLRCFVVVMGRVFLLHSMRPFSLVLCVSLALAVTRLPNGWPAFTIAKRHGTWTASCFLRKQRYVNSAIALFVVFQAMAQNAIKTTETSGFCQMFLCERATR